MMVPIRKRRFVAQQERARVTRATVIEGAARTFERLGYGNASLTDIAETAAVTKGALYFHFKSKEELAKAVIDEQHARVRERPVKPSWAADIRH